MKRLIFAALVVVCSFVFGHALGNPTLLRVSPERRHQIRMQQITTGLVGASVGVCFLLAVDLLTRRKSKTKVPGTDNETDAVKPESKWPE